MFANERFSAAPTFVYDDGRLLHFPGPNPGTPYTSCGVDAGAMRRAERPITWAGVWCTECMRSGLD